MNGFIHPPIYLTPPRASSQVPVYLNPQYYPSTTYVAVTPAYPAYPVTYFPTAYPVPIQTHVIAWPVVPGIYFPYTTGIQQPAAPSGPEKMSFSSTSKAGPEKEQKGEKHTYESFPDPVTNADNAGKTEGGGDHVMSGALDGGGNAGASTSDTAGKSAEKKAGGK